MIDTSGLFDEWSIVSFIAGMVTVWLWQRAKCWWKNRADGGHRRPPKWNPVVLAVAVALVGFATISHQGTENAEAVRHLAIATAKCQEQFNKALRIRGQITIDNDKWSRVQREALASWIHDLIFPPAPYASMKPDDPQRTAWTIVRTQQVDREIAQAQEEQRKNDEERSKPENQYPEPTCGLESLK